MKTFWCDMARPMRVSKTAGKTLLEVLCPDRPAGVPDAGPPLVLTLPWPPTVNTYYRHVGHKVLISAAGRAYRESVAAVVRAAKPRTGLLKLTIHFRPPDRRTRDLGS